MLNKEVLIWIFFYFIVNTFYYIIIGIGENTDEYKRYVSVIIVTVVYISFILLYRLDDTNLTVVRRSIAFSMIIAVLLLIYDFLYPGTFSLLPASEVDISGRAVATYVNQNIVGAVLILGLILSIDLIPRGYRMLYIVYLFAGIAVTFSRSNIIIFFIILFLMAFQRKISRIGVLVIYLVIFMLLTWLMFFGLEWLSSEFDINISDNLINRLSFFVDSKDADTHDLNERKMVLNAALNMFMEHPIFGNGFASTITWKYRVGPHNTFALTWAEFGLLGLTIIPLFLFSATYKIFKVEKKEYRDIGVLFIVYFSLSSMFSHNMLNQTFNYVGAAIIVILGSKYYMKARYTNG